MQSVGKFSGLGIVHSDEAVSVGTSQVSILRVKFAAEDVSVAISQGHRMCELSHHTCWLGDPLGTVVVEKRA